ncbi:MAG TPA: HAD-IIIC family phosphatase [Caulobacteraceae bacterium]|nr:HAD-IIIC family phosphatase [Caulobacteraceae bacterium]
MGLGAGERLQLRRLARKLLARADPPEGFRTFRLLLVSNRTLSFLASDLQAAGLARGLLIDAVETDYDAVRALALGAAEPPAGRFEAVLLMLDADFFPAGVELLDQAGEAAAFAAMSAEFDAIADGLRTRLQAPVLAATVPAPPELRLSSADMALAGARLRQVAQLNAHIAACAAAGRVVVFDLAGQAAQIGAAAFFDPVRFFQAKTPFALEAGGVVADALTALIAAMTGRAGRVLALDLDNTLWGGVVADDGVAGIVVGQGSPEGEAFLAVQQYALELRRRGVALVACSKNLEEIAREPFRNHPDMLLREEHFSAFLANFDDKATNLARAAAMLDLDPSAFVLLDDNPAERERVRSALPWAMVPELGEDPAHFVRLTVASGYFEHLPLTADDTARVAAYQARADAKALQASIGDYGAYLASLDMELTIAPFDAIGRARIAQLIQKSNQFNPTTRRYTEPEVAAMESDAGCVAWQLRLKDRFADHGMISAIVVRTAADVWTIEGWVMSCRVLERGVEAAIVGQLTLLAAQAGVREIVGLYRPTPRNGLVRDLYPRLGFETVATDADGSASYRLTPDPARVAEPPMRVALGVGASAPAAATL